MASWTAIRRLVTRAALAATVVFLVASAPAAADVDQYGDSLVFFDAQGFVAPCNPSYARLGVPDYSTPIPLFASGVAWVDYFGIPVFVSPPLELTQLDRGTYGAIWPVPSPSQVVPGQYTLHVLLQGNGLAYFPLYFLFTTLSATATIDSALNTDCTPIAAASATVAAARKPSRRVLARLVRVARRDSARWFGRSLGPRARYPKARFCGRTVCVKLRPDARWKPVTRH